MIAKVTRRALLSDCLEIMTTFQRNLSVDWTLLWPREGCEGAWDRIRQEADMLREMIHEIEAGEKMDEPVGATHLQSPPVTASPQGEAYVDDGLEEIA